MVETRGRTLEELDDIFEAKNPCKASLSKEDVDSTLVEVQEIKASV